MAHFEQSWMDKIGSYDFLEEKIEVNSTSGKIYNGVGVDINLDGIHDLFWFNEQPIDKYDNERITRLYVNIYGEWVLRYIDHFIGCY